MASKVFTQQEYDKGVENFKAILTKIPNNDLIAMHCRLKDNQDLIQRVAEKNFRCSLLSLVSREVINRHLEGLI